MAAPASAPERFAADVVLGDGETVHVRAITPADAPALAAFHRRQSPESIYRRYFSPKPELTEADLRHFTHVDFVDRVALVVERHDEMIAWASYERWAGRDDADAAFMVDDEHHGKGIATLLLEHLAAIARSNGIERFTAEVLADNRGMLAVFNRSGWPVQRRFESGVVDLDFPLADTDEFLDSVERREQRADSRAVARLLLPRSIAVVGASDRADSIGGVLWRNVVGAATGPVYPVNPGHETVGGRRAWPTVTAVPGDVSLAVVAVPAGALDSVIEDCIAARVRGAVIITSVESDTIDMTSLIAHARRHGVRLIGPGSMGVAASRAAIGLQASLVPVDLPPGNVAISLQSGSLGASVLRLAQRLDLGLSWFVSLGDKSDVSGNDLLQFWEDDESTRVIAMYTESFGNPRKFARIARRVSRRRPIVAVRTGAAASGPTGSALYQHAGLIEVPSVAAMLDTARVLATQPAMTGGSNVAVLANARSPETLTRVALTAAGLHPVTTPRPLDWRATGADYAEALRAALADDDVHGVIVVHAPPMAEMVAAPVEELEAAAAAGGHKPVVAVLLGGGDGPLRPGSAVPGFAFPEPAAAVLGRLRQYGAWLESEAADPVEELTDVDATTVADVIGRALAEDRGTLDVTDVNTILTAYGIPVPATYATSAADAVRVADEVGYPVAVKAQHRRLGRSLHAGVALDVAEAADVTSSLEAMRTSLGDDADTVVVQQMAPPGLDLRVRSVTDPRVGPLVSVGLGGFQSDLIGDEPSRMAPLSHAAIDALLAGSRAGPALAQTGFDPGGMADILRRVAQLATDHPEITVVDLNPVIVSDRGSWVTDAVITVAPAQRTPTPMRRLD